MSAQLQLNIRDMSRPQVVVLSVNTERTISLVEGKTYRISCNPGTWTGDRITSDPGNANIAAAFVTTAEPNNFLNLQNFSVALSGNYNCTSSSGAAKRLTIQSGKYISAASYGLVLT